MSFKEQLLQLFNDDGMISFLKFALFCLSPTQLNLNELYLQSFNWFKFSYCFRKGVLCPCQDELLGTIQLNWNWIVVLYIAQYCVSIFSVWELPSLRKLNNILAWNKRHQSMWLLISDVYLLFVFQQTWFSHFCLLFRGLNLEGNHHYYIHL